MNTINTRKDNQLKHPKCMKSTKPKKFKKGTAISAQSVGSTLFNTLKVVKLVQLAGIPLAVMFGERR